MRSKDQCPNCKFLYIEPHNDGKYTCTMGGVVSAITPCFLYEESRTMRKDFQCVTCEHLKVHKDDFVVEYLCTKQCGTNETKICDKYQTIKQGVQTVKGPNYYASLEPQPVEVALKWRLDFCRGSALKYIARAGTKPGSSLKEDIEKAIHFLQIFIAEEKDAV